MFSLHATPIDLYKNRDVEILHIQNADVALDQAQKLLACERDGKSVFRSIRLISPVLGIDMNLSTSANTFRACSPSNVMKKDPN